MYPHNAANNRYNTYRRTIHETVDPRNHTIALETKGQSYELSSVSPLRLPALTPFAEDRMSIRVSHSVLQMVKVQNGGCFMLCAGTDVATGRQLIALRASPMLPTPSEYEMWFRFAMDKLRVSTTWKAAWFGGEVTNPSVIHGFRSLGLPGLRTFSGYGPAEMTVSSTKAEVFYHDEDIHFPSPGGYMLPNYCAYVVNEKLEPVPVGVPGEMALGGVGVAMGFMGLDDLTKQQFLPDPFMKTHPHYVAHNWNRMYRSGDHGYPREDGAIYCVGRIDGDTQVKLRVSVLSLARLKMSS